MARKGVGFSVNGPESLRDDLAVRVIEVCRHLKRRKAGYGVMLAAWLEWLYHQPMGVQARALEEGERLVDQRRLRDEAAAAKPDPPANSGTNGTVGLPAVGPVKIVDPQGKDKTRNTADRPVRGRRKR